MKGEVRIGLIGAGGAIGRTHLRCLSQLDGVRVAAVSGTRQTAESPTLEGVRILSPLDVARSKDLDLVAIAAPSGEHATLALAALEAGNPIVVEKPLAVTEAEARRVVATARSSGLFGALITQRRLEARMIALHRLLREQNLGQVLLAEANVHWHRDSAYYASRAWRSEMPAGGSLMNQAFHSIDLLEWLVGPVVEVTGMVGTFAHRIDAEDTAVALMRLNGGGFASISATTGCGAPSPATLEIVTEKGRLRIVGDRCVEWSVPGVNTPAVLVDEPRPSLSGAANPEDIGDVGHMLQWRSILDSFVGGTPPTVTLQDGWRDVAIVDGVYRSAERATPVRIPLLCP